MRLTCLGAVALMACNNVGFSVTSIRPTYGWEDGCTQVKVSGNSFGDDINVSLGGNAVENITRPSESDDNYYEGDEEFFLYASTPPGGVGATELIMESDGVESTVTGAFYYVACPGAAYLETVTPDVGVASGDTISIGGCGIADTMTVTLTDPTAAVADQNATLTSTCHTAYASFTAPDIGVTPPAEGTELYVLIKDSTGAVVNPATGWPCTPDSATVCDDPLTITYGGGE